MMKTNQFSFVLSFLFFTHCIHAQNIIGFWEFTKVLVGDQVMTPTAKWTNIYEDGTYDSGNGWLQNGTGTWTYNEATKSFTPTETYGLDDPFGAFAVSFQGDKMTWVREEEGMKVTVSLERADTKPKAPADWLAGLWDLRAVTREGKDFTSTFDPDGKHYLFIRPDRVYVERTSEGKRATGYWHINGHKPELTLISHQADQPNVQWRVSPSEQSLTLTGLSESNNGLVLKYARIREFPK